MGFYHEILCIYIISSEVQTVHNHPSAFVIISFLLFITTVTIICTTVDLLTREYQLQTNYETL